jgi:hypothetical protein
MIKVRGEFRDMANITGTVNIQSISDRDMVKIYEFKEKHGSAFTFSITTGMGGQQADPKPEN